jgi:single-stranded-DNA-specific exonuclease
MFFTSLKICPEEMVEKVASLTMHPIIEKLLADRGFATEEEMEEFLSLSPALTYSPFLMKDMDAVVHMLIKYANEGRKICVYGDYDADGVTSVVLLLQILGDLTQNLMHYIPSRFDEGYGLNKEAIRAIADAGAEMIITTDCGCVSHVEVEYGKELGIFMIVTDHHNIDERAPDCLMINPKRRDCFYPYDMLCGCGVAFKVAQAIQRKAGLPRSSLNKLLDLVAIATVGDIVPLLDENRTLVKIGLKRVMANKRPGLAALLAVSDIKPESINSTSVAFGIVPRINAAGRMNSADYAVRLLTSEDETEAGKLADLLAKNNDERKNVQAETYERIKALIEEKHVNDKFIVADGGDSHEGIAGIVAGKLKDDYNRPVVIITNSSEEGMVKGTGRSVPGIDIFELIKRRADLFERYGGHAGACGFMMRADNAEQLRESLVEAAEQLYEEDPDLFKHNIKIDAVIKIKELSYDFIEQLKLLEPYGHCNEKPMFAIQRVKPKNTAWMAKGKKHIRAKVYDDSGAEIDCVAFFVPEKTAELLESGEYIDVAGYPEKNVFRNMTRLQFIIKGVRPSKVRK